MKNTVLIGFPNLGEEAIPVEIVLSWNITDEKKVGEIIFFKINEPDRRPYNLYIKAKDLNKIRSGSSMEERQPSKL